MPAPTVHDVRFVPELGSRKNTQKGFCGAGLQLQWIPYQQIHVQIKNSHNRLHGAGQDIHTASGLSSSFAHFMLVSVSAAVLDRNVMIGDDSDLSCNAKKGGTDSIWALHSNN